MLVSLLLAGCVRQPPAPPVPPAAVPSVPPYQQGLTDAMYPLPSEVVDDLLVLTPDQPGLQWDDSGRVLVHTWSRAKFYGEEYVPGYGFDLYGETWFTSGTQVADVCAGLAGDELALRVEQLLGLPAGGGRDVFLSVWIDPAELFRPCAAPEVDSPTCPLSAPLAADGADVYWSCGDEDDLHQQWLCKTWTERYGASNASQRYPWTALGYTYDWGDLNDPVGATEFVAPAGTPVTLEAMVSNEAFCAE